MAHSPGGTGRPPRLAELMGALSLAADLGAGMAPETVLGATVLAVRLGRELGLDETRLAQTYYACVTRFLGCTSTATEAAQLGLGEDTELNYALLMCDTVDADQVQASLEKHLAPGRPALERRASILAIRELVPQLPAISAAHCEQAKVLAGQLPLPEGTVPLLSHMYDRWDGKVPGPRGDAIPLAARVITLAVHAELFRRAGGLPASVAMVRERAGGQLDPGICDLFVRVAPRLFEGFAVASLWELYLREEPGEPRRLDEAGVAAVARAFADFIDQKCGWMMGHSRQVAALALLAAEAAGLQEADRRQVYLAALMHDIGLAAVPNGILDRAGPLNPLEMTQAQGHAQHTKMVLGITPALAPVLAIAAAAHDFGHAGRRPGEDLKPAILAAADRYHSLTHERAWRPARGPEAAAQALHDAVRSGQLPAEAVSAVLQAAGHARRSSPRLYPDGLSKREAQVLALLARGQSTKGIAASLAISPKTADHHVQAVYGKTGARSRAAAALYALAHGIIDR